MADVKEDSLWSTLPDFAKKVTYEYKGYVLQTMIAPRYLPDIANFKVRPDDIFLITYPKSGTTWTQNIITLIFESGSEEKEKNEKHLFQKVPFLEMPQSGLKETAASSPGKYKEAEEKPSPRILKTQLPMDLLPRELDEKKPKIIYVARNPKDNAVSYFSFCSLSENCPQYTKWSEFFHDFYRGAVPRGSWFDNVLPWWHKRHEPNVLFLKYEDMKKDLRSCVTQIADFLERPLSDEAIDTIVAKSTFDAMKNNPKTNPDRLMESFKNAVDQNKSFLRKGEVGDWKNYFTVAQNESFDALYREKLQGTELTFEFELN